MSTSDLALRRPARDDRELERNRRLRKRAVIYGSIASIANLSGAALIGWGWLTDRISLRLGLLGLVIAVCSLVGLGFAVHMLRKVAADNAVSVLPERNGGHA